MYSADEKTRIKSRKFMLPRRAGKLVKMIKAVFNEEYAVNVNDTNRDAVEFVKSIDFEPLWKFIQEKVGEAVAFETPEIRVSRRNTVTIEWQSENLAERAGIMKIAYKNLRICNFGGAVVKDTENDGKLKYWCSAHWGFEYRDGGSNGSGIAHVRYTDELGWEFA